MAKKEAQSGVQQRAPSSYEREIRHLVNAGRRKDTEIKELKNELHKARKGAKNFADEVELGRERDRDQQRVIDALKEDILDKNNEIDELLASLPDDEEMERLREAVIDADDKRETDDIIAATNSETSNSSSAEARRTPEATYSP